MAFKKYHIITFGCQANVADSERIASRLEKQGYKKTEQIEKASQLQSRKSSSELRG